MRIFIGHDTRYEDASSVCRQSIIENSSPNEHKITYLHKEKLKNAGVYGRADVEGEKKKEKYYGIANGMLDSILRGTGVGGAAVMTGKNIAVDVAKRAKRSRPNFQDSAWKLLDISPPLDSKVTKLRSAGYTIGKEKDEILDKGLSLDNPANMAIAQTIAATTNVPLDRVLRLYDNTKAAVAEDTETWQRVALALGWSTWELGMEDEKNQKEKKIKPFGKKFGKTFGKKF